MPRRKFTARDVAPLRRLTEKIVEREPDAALVVNAAEPFKRRIHRAKHEERAEVPLPVEIETSRRPQGVPLHEIARLAKEEVPGVTGIAVKPGGVSLKFDTQPTKAQRRKIESLLADKARLEELRPAVRAPRPVVGRPVADDDVLRILHDPQTTDAAWLRAFRAFAMQQVVPPSPE